MRDAKNKVKNMFAQMGNPPAANQAAGVLDVPHAKALRRSKSEPMTQLNLRVPSSAKRRVRVLAARDNVSLSELILRALELYEERFGRAPDL